MDTIIFVLIVLFIWFMGFFMGSTLDEDIKDQAKDLKAQCELELPRNQKCIMKYVPDHQVIEDE